MAKQKPKFTEPTSVPCVYVTGGMVHVDGGVVRIVYWSSMPTTKKSDALRIECCVAMTPEVARALHGDLRRGIKALKRAGKL